MSDIMQAARRIAQSARLYAAIGGKFDGDDLENTANIIDRLAAELARAREALGRIADLDVTVHREFFKAQRIASDALAAELGRMISCLSFFIGYCNTELAMRRPDDNSALRRLRERVEEADALVKSFLISEAK